LFPRFSRFDVEKKPAYIFKVGVDWDNAGTVQSVTQHSPVIDVLCCPAQLAGISLGYEAYTPYRYAWTTEISELISPR